MLPVNVTFCGMKLAGFTEDFLKDRADIKAAEARGVTLERYFEIKAEEAASAKAAEAAEEEEVGSVGQALNNAIRVSRSARSN